MSPAAVVLWQVSLAAAWKKLPDPHQILDHELHTVDLELVGILKLEMLER